MNKYIAKILYHTHDKWQVEIKYRDDLIKMLEFCIVHNRSKTEDILKQMLHQVEKDGSLLITKGIINIFCKEMPEVMRDYFIVFDNNKLKSFYVGDKNGNK